MKKTDKKILEEIIRVDHAGERGAVKIYEGQLLALNTIKNVPNLIHKSFSSKGIKLIELKIDAEKSTENEQKIYELIV